MKNRISYLLLGVLGLVGLYSCEEQLEDISPVKTRTVYFSTGEKEALTRTGITIEDKVVTPDWRKTQAANVHLFETGGNGGVSVGEDVEISISADNHTATFKADFPAEWSIIVDPADPSQEGAKAAVDNGPYTYSAVVAQQVGDYFTVPAVQYPDAETLIDPDADFLIGYSRKSYSEPHDYEENVVNLYFDRPVSMSRITLSNFAGTGEKVKSVTIKAESGLTGSVAYGAIDFENAEVTFTPGTESGSIELSYGNGVDIKSDGTFQAYFISVPGTVSVTSVEVNTDQYKYTKAFEGGKSLTFSNKSFKNINLDLATATREEAAPAGTTWYKASVLEDGIDYLIVSQGYALKNNNGSTAGVSVTDDDGVITLETADPTIVWTSTAKTYTTGDNGEGGIVAGHFTLTNNGYYLRRQSNTDILLDTEIPSDKPKYVVWDYDGSYLKHESSETATFFCFYDSGWSTGYTSNGAAPGSDIKTVQIYTNRQPQTLSFSEATVTYDIDEGGDFPEPVLEGARTAVTYSSSNETVATVDLSTGAVTVKKVGSADITATAAGNAEYQAATAKYTIVASSGATDTLYLASEIVAGESYMVVSGGYAMTTDGSTLGTVPVTVNNGIIQISAAEVSLFEAAEHVEYFEGTSPAGHYTLSYGGKFLQRYSNQSTQTGDIGAENGKYYVWDYDGEHLYQISRTGNQGTYYIYYSSGWKFEYQSSPNTYLYTTTKQLQPRNLAFSKENVTCVLGETPEKPVLNGVTAGNATWFSSETGVATVDDNGNVTPVALGTTTIKVVIDANDDYNAGTASYTLKVTDGNVPTWYKAEEIEDGETYLIVSNGYVLQNDGGSAAAIAIEENDGVIIYDAPASVLFTATASSGKFTFKNNGQYMQRGGSSGSYTPAFSSSQSSYYQWTYDNANSYLTTSGNSTYYVYYSSGNSRWSMGTSSGTSHVADLYSANPPRQPQELELSSTSVTFDIAAGGTFTAPTLSGAQTTVIWSSSKPTVATVNETTGAVEIIGTGTTVITASAKGTNTIKPATASYTLHVTDSSSPVTEDTYVKVTSASDLVAGAKYILVYEDGSKVFKPTLNGSNFTTTGNALDVAISDGTIVTDDIKDCQMTLEDGYYFYVESVSRYLYPTYNNMGAEETKSSSHSFSISISSGTATVSRTSNNTTYNLRYSSSSGYFQSSSSSANVALYKLEDN